MTPERWQQVKDLLHGALEVAPEQRSSFLDQACSGDHSLRREVESLLASPDQVRSGFLQPSAMWVTLAKGTRLGDYEVQSLIGSGGMGEVYRAHDVRLGRDVAIKILLTFLPRDPDRLRRFEQEARAAAALNHPNILAVFQMGTHEGAPYLVSELLEGSTLREYERHGAVPIRKALDYAIQTAHGLATAHEKGIVHRDLKPENLFVTKDGRIKILDFGLAKLTRQEVDWGPTGETVSQTTQPGMLMGTVGYMAPEQVRGERIDHRADVFALGGILYEMLAGKRAFQGPTNADIMGSILKDDAPSLAQVTPTVPLTLQRVIQRCLEKNPEQRFQSASDLAFALEEISESILSDGSSRKVGVSRGAVKPLRTPWLRIGATILSLAAVSGIAWFAGLHFAPANPILFEDVILRRGQFGQARFAPDGRTVIYAAGFRFGEHGLYMADANTQVGRLMEIPNADLRAVSAQGSVAVLLSPHKVLEHAGNAIVGTLARSPLSGGTPRPILENVQSADWSPDGSKLAISRYDAERNTYSLEYPIGHVLYETKGYISDVRISPDDKFVAFMDHPVLGDNMGRVAIVDQAGRRKTISPGSWPASWGEEGLAWSPSSKEVWFTNDHGLWASDLSARTRSLLQIAGLYLRDIARNGSLLLYQSSGGVSMTLHSWNPAAIQRDLSWLDLSYVTDISEDGQFVLFSEAGIAGGPEYMMYIRKTDGSPAVQLSPGRMGAISPDLRWAITVGFNMQLSLVPLSAGETRPLSNDSITHFEARWMPDSKHFVFVGEEPGHGERIYLQGVDGDLPKPIISEPCAVRAVSSDGELFLAECTGNTKWKIFRLKGGQSFVPKGLQPGDSPLSWTKANHLWILNSSSANLARIFKLNPESGSRELWKEVHLDLFSGIMSAVITPDGNTFVHTDWTNFGSLRRVSGLR